MITQHTKLTGLVAVITLLGLFLGFPRLAHTKSLSQSLSGEIDMRAYYNEVSGNEDLSFMTEGANVLTDLYFYYDNKTGVNNQIQWSGEVYVQGTDDPQYRIRGDAIRLQNIYLTAEKKDAWKFTGGYYSERYTQYTMNSVLLGLNGWMKVSDNLRLRAFGGRANRARPGNQLRRFAGGGRLEYSLAKNHMLSLSYVQTEDDEDSLEGNELNGVDTFSNSVQSIDYQGEFTQYNLTVSGEWASSEFDSEPVGGGRTLDNEAARKFNIRWRPYETTEVSGKYEKVDPDFRTLSGFATTDREMTRVSWNQVVTEEINFKSQYEEWEDGLEGNTQHDVTRWEVDARYTPSSNDEAYWRKELAVRYESREDEGDTPGLNDSGDPNNSDEHLLDVELWNQFGKNELTLGYTWDENKTDSTVRKEWTLDYSRRFEAVSGWNIPVSYNLNSSYKTDENDVGSTENIDRTFRIDNQVILAEGQREELSLSHGYLSEDPSGASNEIITESVEVSYNRILNRELGSRLSLSYEMSDNQTEAANDNQEYKEVQYRMRYTTPF